MIKKKERSSWKEYNRRRKEEIDGLPLHQQERFKKALAKALKL